MYRFNKLLYKNLSGLLGMTNDEFSMKVFGIKSKYLMRYKSEDRITVNELVGICNRFHISFSHFISLDESDIFTNDLSKYVINAQIFAPITFHAENIQNIYGSNGLAGGITKSAFSKQIGISPKSIYLYYSNPANCTMKLKMLFDICNRYGIDISSFIEDRNIPLPQNKDLHATSTDETVKLNKELLRLRNIVAEGRIKIIELSNENERLKAAHGNYGMVSDNASVYAPCTTSIRKWTFNKALLDSLPMMTETAKDKFFKQFGMCNPSAQYRDGNIPLVMLIDICNLLHISARHFFLRGESGEHPAMSLDDYRSADYRQVSFKPEDFRYLIGKGNLTGMSMGEMLERIGFSKDRFYSYRDGKADNLRVDDMTGLCNALNVSPFCFIQDRNHVNAYSITQAEFFLEENRMLRMENIRLREKLRKKEKGSE